MNATLPDAIAMAKPKRCWVQFSVRSLMVMVIVICVPLACLALKLDKKRRERAALVGLGLKTSTALIKPFAGQTCDRHGYYAYDWVVRGKAEPPGAPWLPAILGDDFFGDVVCVQCYDPEWTDADLARLEALPSLMHLSIFHAQISDAGLAPIGRLGQLRNLLLVNVPISDEGLRHIEGLTKLRGLRIQGHRRKLTDAGLVHLRPLKKLEVLILRKGDFTEAGIANLQENLPNCRILFDPSSREFPVPVLAGS